MKLKLEEIRKIADELVEHLKPFCKRIEIAGSIRRGMPECKDIDIVCIPDSWHLEKFLLDKRNSGTVFEKNGSLYKKFHVNLSSGSCWVDLYITDAEHWGLIYLIRTGSADFNKKWIQALYKKDGRYKVDDGKLFNNGVEIPVPEESDLFFHLKWNFIEPKDRK